MPGPINVGHHNVQHRWWHLATCAFGTAVVTLQLCTTPPQAQTPASWLSPWIAHADMLAWWTTICCRSKTLGPTLQNENVVLHGRMDGMDIKQNANKLLCNFQYLPTQPPQQTLCDISTNGEPRVTSNMFLRNTFDKITSPAVRRFSTRVPSSGKLPPRSHQAEFGWSAKGEFHGIYKSREIYGGAWWSCTQLPEDLHVAVAWNDSILNCGLRPVLEYPNYLQYYLFSFAQSFIHGTCSMVTGLSLHQNSGTDRRKRDDAYLCHTLLEVEVSGLFLVPSKSPLPKTFAFAVAPWLTENEKLHHWWGLTPWLAWYIR